MTKNFLLFYFYTSLYGEFRKWSISVMLTRVSIRCNSSTGCSGSCYLQYSPRRSRGPISELCVRAGCRRTHTDPIPICPSTNHITSGLFCLNFKFKGLGQMTSKTLWIYTRVSWTTKRTALEGEKWNYSTHFPGSLKLFMSFVQSEPYASYFHFMARCCRKCELGENLNLSYL